MFSGDGDGGIYLIGQDVYRYARARARAHGMRGGAVTHARWGQQRNLPGGWTAAKCRRWPARLAASTAGRGEQDASRKGRP